MNDMASETDRLVRGDSNAASGGVAAEGGGKGEVRKGASADAADTGGGGAGGGMASEGMRMPSSGNPKLLRCHARFQKHAGDERLNCFEARKSPDLPTKIVSTSFLSTRGERYSHTTTAWRGKR